MDLSILLGDRVVIGVFDFEVFLGGVRFRGGLLLYYRFPILKHYSYITIVVISFYIPHFTIFIFSNIPQSPI